MASLFQEHVMPHPHDVSLVVMTEEERLAALVALMEYQRQVQNQLVPVEKLGEREADVETLGFAITKLMQATSLAEVKRKLPTAG